MSDEPDTASRQTQSRGPQEDEAVRGPKATVPLDGGAFQQLGLRRELALLDPIING